MFGEDLAEAANVVRFPVELRVAASTAVLDGLEPDPREVAEVAERLGLDLLPADLFERADEETARYIAEQILPLAPHERRRALDGLLRPLMTVAAETCRSVREAAGRAALARSALGRARAMGGDWLAPLERASNRRLLEMATLLVEAHGRCQVARGVARAVGLARCGETWTPVGGAAGWRGEAARGVNP